MKSTKVAWSAEDERNAILEMLWAMHPDVDPDAIDGYHPLDVLEVITSRIEDRAAK